MGDIIDEAAVDDVAAVDGEGGFTDTVAGPAAIVVTGFTGLPSAFIVTVG